MEREIRFIDKLYKDLYLSEEVLHHSSGNKTEKYRNLREYFEFLEEIHNKSELTESRKERLKKLYHDKYVIKGENIPESYYETQKIIALERGYGHIEITKETKAELQKEVIDNQIKSLDVWLDYFLSEDAKVYPFWAKYWAFQGMLKLGTYDKAKGQFNKRRKETVGPFSDLNREALSISIDMVIKYLQKEEIEDKELEELVKNGSFQKVYTYVLRKTLTNNKDIVKKNEGKWVKYNQGTDHMQLVKTLQGYNTGWCTAGEATAKSQLSMGDFYVYYTLDENKEYKVPRIAIRMEYGQIGEIRGIGKDQNIEPEMEKVVEEKIKEFPDREKYYKKVRDMKKLTEIYNKQIENKEISIEELKFLYEIEGKIEGFGYDKDPRIEEIKQKREARKDLSKIFACKEEEIAQSKGELTTDTKVYNGDLDYSIESKAEYLIIPPYILGNLYLSSLTSAEGLTLPKSIGGSLYLRSLTSAEGLVLPKSIGRSLDLSWLTSAKDLVFPESIGESLYLIRLTSAEGLTLPKSIGGSLYLRSLTSAEGLVLPQSIGGYLDLSRLTSAVGLELPDSIGESLYLSSLTSAKDLVLPESIGRSLDLSSLTSAEGLVLPKSIGESLYLSSLTSAEGLVLPKSIRGSLDLSSLTSTEELVLPESIGDFLHLSSLTSAEGLVLPKIIGSGLSLINLTSAKGLTLPKSIGRYLDLSKLTSAEGLVLPESLDGCLYLNSLTSTEGLILPEYLTYEIKLPSGKIIPENYNRKGSF